jgi:kynurenine formamidase
MAHRFVDLSIFLENDVITDPPMMRPKITYQAHHETMVESNHFFPGVTAEALPGGEGFAAVETITLSTHNGTHLDAPWHFHPTMDAMTGEGGQRSITIDEVPLDWCFRPGVKLDFTGLPDGYVVTAADVEAELARIGHDLQPLDIVLVNTAAGKAVGNPDYINIGCGMGYEATLYLTSRGVRVTGTDAWSWDAPFSHRRYVVNLGGAQGRTRYRLLPS